MSISLLTYRAAAALVLSGLYNGSGSTKPC